MGGEGLVVCDTPLLTATGSPHLSDAHVRPWSPLAFSPAQPAVPEGANATFTCSFSSTSKGFVLNWYRMSPSNQTDKLAAFPEDSSQPGRDRHFRVTPLPDGQDFHTSVVAPSAMTVASTSAGPSVCFPTCISRRVPWQSSQ